MEGAKYVFFLVDLSKVGKVRIDACLKQLKGESVFMRAIQNSWSKSDGNSYWHAYTTASRNLTNLINRKLYEIRNIKKTTKMKLRRRSESCCNSNSFWLQFCRATSPTREVETQRSIDLVSSAYITKFPSHDFAY